MNQLPVKVGEQFRVASRIGGGGFGQVYRAQDLKLDRDVAIKILQVLDSSDPAARARFEREAKVLCLLNHPHIVHVFNYGLDGEGHPYIVMQLLDGESLGEVLRREGKIAPLRAAALLAQAASAVNAAHAEGVVHRDLKPDNIMLDKDDHVTVVDFGVSGFLFGTESDIQKLTQTGQVIGTWMYMSPEICLGGKATAQTDVYALGCILYHCLAGRPPFEANDPVELLRRHIGTAPEPLPENTPRDLQLIAFKAMQKDPAKRFLTAGEFEQALRAVLAGRRPDVHDDDVRFGAAAKKRLPLRPVVLLALVLAGLLAIGGWIVATRRPNFHIKYQTPRHTYDYENPQPTAELMDHLNRYLWEQGATPDRLIAALLARQDDPWAVSEGCRIAGEREGSNVLQRLWLQSAVRIANDGHKVNAKAAAALAYNLFNTDTTEGTATVLGWDATKGDARGPHNAADAEKMLLEQLELAEQFDRNDTATQYVLYKALGDLNHARLRYDSAGRYYAIATKLAPADASQRALAVHDQVSNILLSRSKNARTQSNEIFSAWSATIGEQPSEFVANEKRIMAAEIAGISEMEKLQTQLQAQQLKSSDKATRLQLIPLELLLGYAYAAEGNYDSAAKQAKLSEELRDRKPWLFVVLDYPRWWLAESGRLDDLLPVELLPPHVPHAIPHQVAPASQ